VAEPSRVPALQAHAFQNARFPFQWFSVSDSMNAAMLRKLSASIAVPGDGKKQYFRHRECQLTCPMCLEL
jgi:hypothetical protein